MRLLQVACRWLDWVWFHRQPLQAIYGLLGHGTSTEKDALSDQHGARCLVQDIVQGVHVLPPHSEPRSIAVLHLLGWSA